MSNEGFHEIQLNGKQLVFLFMAATVVLVVTFLCGVMVGRGVDAQLAVATAEAAEQAALDPTAAALAPPPPAVGARTGAPITAGETLTYPDRLGDPNPPAETLTPAVETAASMSALPEPSVESEPVAVEPEARATPVVTAASAPADPLSEPPGNGFVVQVAAVRERDEAETIARRLSTKGYPAFVTTPGNGAPSVFRVRVGKYDDRRDAESIAGRLQTEEQFKPWITR